jgi:hypothetical protein
MLSMVTLHDKVGEGQTTLLIWGGSNLIRFSPKAIALARTTLSEASVTS